MSADEVRSDTRKSSPSISRVHRSFGCWVVAGQGYVGRLV